MGPSINPTGMLQQALQARAAQGGGQDPSMLGQASPQAQGPQAASPGAAVGSPTTQNTTPQLQPMIIQAPAPPQTNVSMGAPDMSGIMSSLNGLSDLFTKGLGGFFQSGGGAAPAKTPAPAPKPTGGGNAQTQGNVGTAQGPGSPYSGGSYPANYGGGAGTGYNNLGFTGTSPGGGVQMQGGWHYVNGQLVPG